MVRIKFIGLTATGIVTNLGGRWLKSYDASYVNPEVGYDGGRLITTDDPSKAEVFPDIEAALAKWKSQAPEPYHLRVDGKPNRPLTAFMVEFERLTQ